MTDDAAIRDRLKRGEATRDSIYAGYWEKHYLTDVPAMLHRVAALEEAARTVIQLAETTPDTVQYMGLPIDVSVVIGDLRRVLERETT